MGNHIAAYRHSDSHQNKCPQKLITASLAVSRQILHSKFAFAFGCSVFDAPAAAVRSFISPSEVAILFSVAMLFDEDNVIRELETSAAVYDREREGLGKTSVDRHHGE